MGQIIEFGLLSAEDRVASVSFSLRRLSATNCKMMKVKLLRKPISWPSQKWALIIDNQEFIPLFTTRGWRVAFGPIDEYIATSVR
ncbi:hypothetical protein ACVXHB_30215, partial [Escherichia coli]